jgi:hypothetical protein
MKFMLEIEGANWSNFCIQHFDQKSMDFKRKLKIRSVPSNLKGIE